VRERLVQFKQRIYLVFGTKKLFMVCPEAASGKLRKPDLRVIGKRVLGEGSYCWSDFCVVVNLLERIRIP